MEMRKVPNAAKENADPSAPHKASPAKEEIIRHGVSAAPGIVIGPAFVMNWERYTVPDRRVPARSIDKEVATFKSALDATREELVHIKSALAAQLGDDHAKIFDAHLLILDDVMIVDDTEAMIRRDNRSAAWAFQHVISNVTASFEKIEDEYLKDRLTDIIDVKRRVIGKLLGRGDTVKAAPTEPSIVIARDISPSETAQLDRKVVLGYATDLGGRTSHTAILARSQGVAAVVGLEDLSPQIESGDRIIVDGNTGTVVINPYAETIENYQREIEQYKKLEEELLTLTAYPAVTLDDREIELHANIDLPEEIEAAFSYGAQGVGLFRTEYFFISQEQLPTEEEQYRVYRSVIKKARDKPVTIRVLDIGGDKIADYLHGSRELNPFMGWRGIRFLLTRKDIFKTQLRAIYRASAHGRVQVLLPLIVDLDEVAQAKSIFSEVRNELKARRYRFDNKIKIGVMIETPSAVTLADLLADEVDFFSIGTNDLIQYTMAVDRGNSKISHLYRHLHPSIIRMLKKATDAGQKKGIPVAVCGEMAVDPLSMVVLLGLGVDGLSCSPRMMPEVKKVIRSVTYDECKTLVRRILKRSTAREIERDVRKLLKERCPELPLLDTETP